MNTKRAAVTWPCVLVMLHKVQGAVFSPSEVRAHPGPFTGQKAQPIPTRKRSSKITALCALSGIPWMDFRTGCTRLRRFKSEVQQGSIDGMAE